MQINILDVLSVTPAYQKYCISAKAFLMADDVYRIS